MRAGALAGLVIAYAAALAAGSWLVERLPPLSTRLAGPVSPWAREEAARFRRAMARVVRLISGFVLVAVLVRFRGTAWSWLALLLLLALAAAEVLAARRGPPRGARETLTE